MTPAEYNSAVDAHADGIYRFALKHLRDSDLAKDVVQETFARLWAKADQVDGTKAKSYLFTTAHHVIVDEARKGTRVRRMEEHHEDLRHTSQAQPDLKEVLDAALATLPPVQRSVVLLRDLEGYAYEEIAELTGLNLPQVKVYIYRGRTALKDYIGQLDLVI
jgi:RNA polymerase sigma factor (sigma-70 family)